MTNSEIYKSEHFRFESGSLTNRSLSSPMFERKKSLGFLLKKYIIVYDIDGINPLMDSADIVAVKIGLFIGGRGKSFTFYCHHFVLILFIRYFIQIIIVYTSASFEQSFCFKHLAA